MCWYCGTAIEDEEPIGRTLKCIDCGKDLRSCKNCRHIAPSGCRESSAEKLNDLERANFCDWFSLNPKLKEKTEGDNKAKNAASAAKTAFDNLFN